MSVKSVGGPPEETHKPQGVSPDRIFQLAKTSLDNLAQALSDGGTTDLIGEETKRVVDLINTDSLKTMSPKSLAALAESMRAAMARFQPGQPTSNFQALEQAYELIQDRLPLADQVTSAIDNLKDNPKTDDGIFSPLEAKELDKLALLMHRIAISPKKEMIQEQGSRLDREIVSKLSDDDKEALVRLFEDHALQRRQAVENLPEPVAEVEPPPTEKSKTEEPSLITRIWNRVRGPQPRPPEGEGRVQPSLATRSWSIVQSGLHWVAGLLRAVSNRISRTFRAVISKFFQNLRPKEGQTPPSLLKPKTWRLFSRPLPKEEQEAEKIGETLKDFPDRYRAALSEMKKRSPHDEDDIMRKAAFAAAVHGIETNSERVSRYACDIEERLRSEKAQVRDSANEEVLRSNEFLSSYSATMLKDFPDRYKAALSEMKKRSPHAEDEILRKAAFAAAVRGIREPNTEHVFAYARTIEEQLRSKDDQARERANGEISISSSFLGSYSARKAFIASLRLDPKHNVDQFISPPLNLNTPRSTPLPEFLGPWADPAFVDRYNSADISVLEGDEANASRAFAYALCLYSNGISKPTDKEKSAALGIAERFSESIANPPQGENRETVIDALQEALFGTTLKDLFGRYREALSEMKKRPPHAEDKILRKAAFAAAVRGIREPDTERVFAYARTIEDQLRSKDAQARESANRAISSSNDFLRFYSARKTFIDSLHLDPEREESPKPSIEDGSPEQPDVTRKVTWPATTGSKVWKDDKNLRPVEEGRISYPSDSFVKDAKRKMEFFVLTDEGVAYEWTVKKAAAARKKGTLDEEAKKAFTDIENSISEHHPDLPFVPYVMSLCYQGVMSFALASLHTYFRDNDPNRAPFDAGLDREPVVITIKEDTVEVLNDLIFNIAIISGIKPVSEDTFYLGSVKVTIDKKNPAANSKIETTTIPITDPATIEKIKRVMKERDTWHE